RGGRGGGEGGGRRGGGAGRGRGGRAGPAAAPRRPAGAGVRRRLAAGGPDDRRGPVPRRAGGRRPAGAGRRGGAGPQPGDGPHRRGHLRPPDPAHHPRAHTFIRIAPAMIPNEAGVVPSSSPSASTWKQGSASTLSRAARSS